jgi:thiamine-phosphate pyrophosphorylase
MKMIVSDGRLSASLDRLAQLVADDVIVQVREKHLEGGALYRLVCEVVAIARPRGARVLVNDRLDVALAAGADGVHLPEHGMSIVDARGLGAMLVSVARHSVEGAVAAVGADLVVLGPIWATPGKGPPLGPGALTAARAALPSSVTLVAIGGIDSDGRAAEARAAGADAVAGIRWFWPPQ